jgi:hypothetical protein
MYFTLYRLVRVETGRFQDILWVTCILLVQPRLGAGGRARHTSTALFLEYLDASSSVYGGLAPLFTTLL